jgi:very-short-patch-repair endonuclease
MKFSMHDIERLQKEKKIRGYNAPEKIVVKAGGRNAGQQRSAAKEWLAWNLPYWCNERAVTLETEFGFHPARKWRFDYAIPSLKIAIEYEGIFADKSRHTTFKGYNADADKYNTAAVMGWRVIRLTAMNYKNVLQQLNEMV